MEKKFKVRMVSYANIDGFRTLCGITEACSEDFFDDPTNLVEFGKEKEVTCKKCLAAWEKEIKEIDRIISNSEIIH